MELVLIIYKLTTTFPVDERYGLISQIRRCAISIPSNIAEGHMRSTLKDFGHFLAIAKGSCAELETQIILGYRLGYMSDEAYTNGEDKVMEISKMLSSLQSKL